MLVLAIIATRSRTALMIVGVALARLDRRSGAFRALSHGDACSLKRALLRSRGSLSRRSHGTDRRAAKGLEFGGGADRSSYELIRSALAMFGQHPFGSRRVLFPAAVSECLARFSSRIAAGLFVHNDYVQFLVEGGVPLLVLLLLSSASVLRRARTLVQLPPRDAHFADLGFAMALRRRLRARSWSTSCSTVCRSASSLGF